MLMKQTRSTMGVSKWQRIQVKERTKQFLCIWWIYWELMHGSSSDNIVWNQKNFKTKEKNPTIFDLKLEVIYGHANFAITLKRIGRPSKLEKELDRRSQKKNNSTFVPALDDRLDNTGHWPAAAEEQGPRCKIPTCSSPPNTSCGK